MKVVDGFPSFGEVSELGGFGPSLDKLYAEGNDYIRSNASFAGMGLINAVTVVEGEGEVEGGEMARVWMEMTR